MDYEDKALFIGPLKRGMEGMLMKMFQVVLYELEDQKSGQFVGQTRWALIKKLVQKDKIGL